MPYSVGGCPVVVWDLTLDHSRGESCLVRHNNSDDDTVKAQSTGKNLDDQHGDESGWGLGVGLGSNRAYNSDRESTGHVADADDEANEEVAEAGELGFLIGV